MITYQLLKRRSQFAGDIEYFLFLIGNITARRTIAEREIKFNIIARRAIKLLIMQLYFPLTAEKSGGDEKTQREAL